MVDIGIGTLAQLTGIKIPTIRFYEQSGLIAPPSRTEGGQRRYNDSAVRRLHLIRHAREFGFDVKDIRQLLEVFERPTMPCDTAMEIAHHHLQQVESKICRLRLIRSELKHMLECCRGGSAADCRILEGLAQTKPIRSKQIRNRRAPPA